MRFSTDFERLASRRVRMKQKTGPDAFDLRFVFTWAVGQSMGVIIEGYSVAQRCVRFLLVKHYSVNEQTGSGCGNHLPGMKFIFKCKTFPNIIAQFLKNKKNYSLE